MVTFRRCVRPFSGYFSTLEISGSFELTLVLLGCKNKTFEMNRKDRHLPIIRDLQFAQCVIQEPLA